MESSGQQVRWGGCEQLIILCTQPPFFTLHVSGSSRYDRRITDRGPGGLAVGRSVAVPESRGTERDASCYPFPFSGTASSVAIDRISTSEHFLRAKIPSAPFRELTPIDRRKVKVTQGRVSRSISRGLDSSREYLRGNDTGRLPNAIQDSLSVPSQVTKLRQVIGLLSLCLE